jgi:shikimate dehydrogenase
MSFTIFPQGLEHFYNYNKSTLNPVSMTLFFGLLGYPLGHSLSPVMHKAALAHLGLDAHYLAFPVPLENLEAAVSGLWTLGCRGFNVTIPHKQVIMPFMQDCTPLAQKIGAVNTVLRTEQGWLGDNTDIAGFTAPLLRQKPNWSEAHALILGCGGAARAVIAGCQALGMCSITVQGRTLENLKATQVQFPEIQILGPEQPVTSALSHTSLVVNTTPLGMDPRPETSPLTQEELALLPTHALVYDLVYNPERTQLLAWSQDRGLATQGGLEMLVHQGWKALQLWLHPGQEDLSLLVVMEKALRQHLGSTQ